MKRIECDACGGNEFKRIDANTVMCIFCETRYADREEAPVVQVPKKSPELIQAEIVSLYTKAEECRKAENYHGEIQYLTEALKLDELNVATLVKTGRCYRLLGMDAEALKCYKKAISIDPNYPQAYGNTGIIYVLQGDAKKGREYLNKAIRLMPETDSDYPTTLGNYAMAVGMTGDKKQAAALLDKAERMGYANAHIVRQRLGIKKGFFDSIFG